ncbi:MAG TPA: BMP family ABC transporter substrate-binding protein [Acetobacteraceae bacterium]|jgi:simple sugar transport system substrate-binding protein
MGTLSRRRCTTLLSSVALCSTALSAPGVIRAARADAPVKIGFVYFGPVGDFGWTYQHDVGRKQAQAAFGSKIVTSFVDNVPEAAECEAVFQDLAATGHKLIFGTSFGYMNYMLRVAARYPDIKFENCTGYKRVPNLATYDIRFYQGRYVQGVIAGAVSKTGIAGYVGSMLVPQVVRGMDAFTLGMRSVNPKARVKLVLVDSWYDPGKEGEAATTLIDQGCDIITQHTNSPAPLRVAASRGVKSFGEATDMISFAPTAELTAELNEWGPYYVRRVGALLGGSWTSTDTWGGFKDGMLAMAPYRNMPASTASLAAKTAADITSGKNKIFVGPLTDQRGKVFLPAGKEMDDPTLSGLVTLVAGIEGRTS